MARIINLSNPYVLEQTGANIDKATGLPFKEVGLAEAQQAQAKENIGLYVDDVPTEGSDHLVKSGGIYDWVLQQLARLKTVAHIEVTNGPSKNIYKNGEALDLNGITVTATYTDGTTDNVTSECVFSPSAGTILSGNEPVSIGVAYRAAETSFHVFMSTPYIDLHGDTSFTLKTKNSNKNWDGTLEYSTDASVWETWDGTSELSSAVHDGEHHIYLRGSGNTKIVGMTDARRWVLTGSGVKCSGDVTMLLNYQAPENITMAEGCFEYLFYECVGLTEAPQLSPLTVPKQGYTSMFEGTSVTETPLLPAKAVGYAGYMNMFSGNVELQSAHDIEATTLGEASCNTMFQNCTSLQNTPAIKAQMLAKNCLFAMFIGCVGLTTLPELPALTLATGCYKRMFENCTNIKVAESESGVYQHAFRIPTDGTGVTATDALTDMFKNTGGTFTGTPIINAIYYTNHEPVA